MSCEEFRDTINDARCIDPREKLVSMTGKSGSARSDSRLTLEILHNIQEPIIYIWLVGKLDLNLIKIAQRILFRVSVHRHSHFHLLTSHSRSG
jgi:hypothetical protein